MVAVSRFAFGKNRAEYCHRSATAVLNKRGVFGMFPLYRDLDHNGFGSKVGTERQGAKCESQSQRSAKGARYESLSERQRR